MRTLIRIKNSDKDESTIFSKPIPSFLLPSVAAWPRRDPLGGDCMTARGKYLLIILLALVGGSTAVLITEAGIQSRQEASAQTFQQLVGGVGFGPAIDLSGCAFSFDPRLDGSCAEDCGSIPGGSCFCPRHAASLFAYPPLDKSQDNAK
jgi:hypothetical protein